MFASRLTSLSSIRGCAGARACAADVAEATTVSAVETRRLFMNMFVFPWSGTKSARRDYALPVCPERLRQPRLRGHWSPIIRAQESTWIGDRRRFPQLQFPRFEQVGGLPIGAFGRE